MSKFIQAIEIWLEKLRKEREELEGRRRDAVVKQRMKEIDEEIKLYERYWREHG